MTANLLDQPHVSLISDGIDGELRGIERVIARPLFVNGRPEFETTLCHLLEHGRPGARKTLDLVGHSTADTSLLVLGDWVIDASSATVTAFFRELEQQNVLPRLGVDAVRLLGCGTAATPHGKWTMCALADILGLEVFGTTGPLLASHYDAGGFADERRYLLVSSSQLRSGGAVAKPIARAQLHVRVLDVDAIPPQPLDRSRPWPVHVVTAEQARELLCLVRRREGAIVPSHQMMPTCEIALPSTTVDHYHHLEVLLDGELVRAQSAEVEGIVYPVSDPATFRELIAFASRR